MEPKNLKLIAKTEEDLRVVSAHLQDSIVNIADMANLRKNKIFDFFDDFSEKKQIFDRLLELRSMLLGL